MGLILNISSLFADTYSNLQGGPGEELRDMDSALTRAINDHVAQPAGNRSFVAAGFGRTWNGAYTVRGLPTDVLTSHGDYIDPFIRPILVTAIATHLQSVALLVNAVAPPIAQGAASIVQSALLRATGGAAPGAPAILASLAAAQAAASTPTGLSALPAAVGGAVAGIAGLVLADIASPQPYGDLVSSLDFDLQTAGVPGATSARPAAWSAVAASISAIPPNPQLAGPLGAKFWQAMLITITQAIPGARAT